MDPVSFKPRPVQLPMIQHMLRTPRCNVWADMGLGKTSATLQALRTARELWGADRILVLGPRRVVEHVWPSAVAQWPEFADLEVAVATRSRERVHAALRSDAPIVAAGYEWIPEIVARCGRTWPFATVIADEATKLKSFRLRNGGKRARYLSLVAERTTRWINLTGTPAPNGLLDLWGQQWFVDHGAALGRTFTAFKQRWFRPAESGYGLVPLPFALEEITERLAPTTLTLHALDWFDLSAPIVTQIPVPLPPSARALYRRMEKEFFAEVGGAQSIAANAAVKSAKCLQIASGTLYTTDPSTGEPTKEWKPVHDAKLEALRSVREEHNGRPIIVTYQWRADEARILRAFPDAVPLSARDAVPRWNRGEIPMLVMHPASGGHGLDLQHGGNIMVFYSQDWNLEHHQQVIERIGPTRQKQAGYDRPVLLYYLVAERTLDEVVIARHRSKGDLQTELRRYMAATP